MLQQNSSCQLFKYSISISLISSRWSDTWLLNSSLVENVSSHRGHSFNSDKLSCVAYFAIYSWISTICFSNMSLLWNLLFHFWQGCVCSLWLVFLFLLKAIMFIDYNAPNYAESTNYEALFYQLKWDITTWIYSLCRNRTIKNCGTWLDFFSLEYEQFAYILSPLSHDFAFESQT